VKLSVVYTNEGRLFQTARAQHENRRAAMFVDGDYFDTLFTMVCAKTIFVFSFPVTFDVKITSPFTSVRNHLLIKCKLSMVFLQHWVNKRYVINSYHKNNAFWSWFDLKWLTFVENMHEKQVSHFCSLGPWLLTPNILSQLLVFTVMSLPYLKFLQLSDFE